MDIQIIMGSKSDTPISEKAEKILKNFDVEYEVTVASAHRAPDVVKDLVEKSKAKVFIGIAGLSAALPGVIASHTTKPVIGVPVSGKINLDSILSIIQMPPGIPVAAVGLDRGDNAALLALEILSLTNKKIQEQLVQYRRELREKSLGKK
jgi:5-(carboxyamino)imidazole ribonucleotide mutase